MLLTLLFGLITMIAAVLLARPLSYRWGRNAGYPIAGLFLVSLALVLSNAPEVLAGETITG
ncbi:hypothetical protein, partial [Pseudonocardia alni]|uniref:hypothetical protein n=1 Tax=Pseudonocardia alni TaxID=33907 RepID=UPI0031F9EE86